MDPEAIGVVRDVFAELDAAIPRERASQTERARELFRVLGREGGLVEAMGDEPSFSRTRIDELGTWSEDPWERPTYGLDASTTRPLEYNNGLVVDTAYAKVAVAGNSSPNPPDGRGSVERGGHVVTVAYLDDADSRLHTRSFDGDHVQGELLAFPSSAEETRNVQKSVATVAQRLSESRQARESLDRIDGPLFVDGAVFPLGVVYWLLLDASGERSPAGSWDVPEAIVRNYVAVIDTLFDRDLPVVGVVKTSTMSQLLDGLRAKIERHGIRDEAGRLRDVPWVRDHQFLAEVLRYDDLDSLTYTSWFVHRGMELDGTTYDLLDPLARHLEHGEPSDYRRAFFYVRLPKNGDVLRVETPALFVRDQQRREQVQNKALAAIARRRGVPRAIERADRLARITRENRETISELLDRTEASFDHNWDGRWSDIEEEPNHD